MEVHVEEAFVCVDVVFLAMFEVLAVVLADSLITLCTPFSGD